MQPVLWAAGGTGFTCLMTALGASMVFFFRKRVSAGAQRIFLGFAAGVMVAAAVWSLLIPAIEEAESSGLPGWLPAAGGFLLGVLFLLAMDYLMPHLHLGAQKPEGRSSSWKRTTLLIFAVTLHNIPEGMAVGFSFALAAQHGNDPALYASAMALAIGMGIQNFPEGAAISLPLRQEGLPAWKSFLYGALSGVVEPIFGILAVLVAGSLQPLLPWLLAFAAGVYFAEGIRNRYHLMEKFHWRQLILLIEIALLFVVGFIPNNLDWLANMLVSFVCAMQVQSFRKVHGNAYASTMCIGNMRSGMQYLYTCLLYTSDAADE
mgnify:CR=1 FL=1